MELDEQRIDEAALALLYLTIHEENRAWKTVDWETMDQLHQQGLISDPKTKAKSVVLTEKGLSLSKQLAHKLFGKDMARDRSAR